jgi:hypothetical protein
MTPDASRWSAAAPREGQTTDGMFGGQTVTLGEFRGGRARAPLSRDKASKEER